MTVLSENLFSQTNIYICNRACRLKDSCEFGSKNPVPGSKYAYGARLETFVNMYDLAGPFGFAR